MSIHVLKPLDPLHYLIDIYSDAHSPPADRLATAIACLPYFHNAMPPAEVDDDEGSEQGS